jgi:hypothetical protein
MLEKLKVEKVFLVLQLFGLLTGINIALTVTEYMVKVA